MATPTQKRFNRTVEDINPLLDKIDNDYSKEEIDELNEDVMRFKGEVNYYNNLPLSANLGDAYKVLYAGTEGTTPDGTTYVRKSFDSGQTIRWVSLSKDGSGGGGGFTPTQSQLDAMNSGINAEDVEQITTNKNNILSDNIISTSFTWSSGYVSTGGYIFSSTQSYFSQPFTLHAGEKIVVRTKNKNVCIIGTTSADSVSVGDTISALRITSSIDQEETYDYTATEDIKIVICVLASNYVAYVANHNTDLLLGSSVTIEQSKTTGMSAGGSDYITVNGIRVYISATEPTGARTGDLWIGG